MAKQVLGRNLDALLEGGAKQAEQTADAAPPEKAPVSSGVRSLMRGHQPSVATPEVPAAARQQSMPPWYLFSGDVLLAALALGIVWKSPHPVSWPRELFCGVAVLLGAGLAVAAVMLADDVGR